MNRETTSATTTVVIVLDGDTEAGYQLARSLLADGRRVAVVARHPGAAIRVMHGQRADQVMVIAADTSDERQWSRLAERVMDRFGRVDTIVRAGDAALLASA